MLDQEHGLQMAAPCLQAPTRRHNRSRVSPTVPLPWRHARGSWHTGHGLCLRQGQLQGRAYTKLSHLSRSALSRRSGRWASPFTARSRCRLLSCLPASSLRCRVRRSCAAASSRPCLLAALLVSGEPSGGDPPEGRIWGRELCTAAGGLRECLQELAGWVRGEATHRC